MPAPEWVQKYVDIQHVSIVDETCNWNDDSLSLSAGFIKEVMSITMAIRSHHMTVAFAAFITTVTSTPCSTSYPSKLNSCQVTNHVEWPSSTSI